MTPPSGRPHWVPFLALAASIVAIDQLTKAWIVAELADRAKIQIVGDVVRLVYTENSGALFGLLQNQAFLFALVSVGVAAIIAVAHARGGRSPYLTITLGLLLGGWAGNFIDRVRLGYVIDFVDLGIGTLRFWAFNVADACITGSLLLLILLALRPAVASWGTGPREET